MCYLCHYICRINVFLISPCMTHKLHVCVLLPTSLHMTHNFSTMYVSNILTSLYPTHTFLHLSDGLATVSRIDKIIGLFRRVLSLLKGSFAKETYDFINPINQSHPIHGGDVQHVAFGVSCLQSQISIDDLVLYVSFTTFRWNEIEIEIWDWKRLNDTTNTIACTLETAFCPLLFRWLHLHNSLLILLHIWLIHYYITYTWKTVGCTLETALCPSSFPWSHLHMTNPLNLSCTHVCVYINCTWLNCSNILLVCTLQIKNSILPIIGKRPFCQWFNDHCLHGSTRIYPTICLCNSWLSPTTCLSNLVMYEWYLFRVHK